MILAENRPGQKTFAQPPPQASTAEQVRRQGQELELRVETWIRQNPALSIGLAVILGASLGWWLKRRL